MKEYFGTREFHRTDAFVRTAGGDGADVRPLDARRDLRDLAVDFEWGVGPGGGPAQLALAILADALGDELAVVLYHDFKWQLVATWGDSWSLTEADVRAWHRQRVTGQHTGPRVRRGMQRPAKRRHDDDGETQT